MNHHSRRWDWDSNARFRATAVSLAAKLTPSMPRNITSMEVSALKGQENMAVCGAEALEALKSLKAEAFEGLGASNERERGYETSGGSAAAEPEPEPELAADESPDQTLQECFLEAETLFRQIGNSGLPTIDPALQELVGSCLAKLAACKRKISDENVFSANEEAEDIKTAELKYLLVPHLTADTMLRQATPGGAVERLTLLAPALGEWNVFVTECERKGLVPPAELAVLHREEGTKLDPASARDEKIARYKADKAETERERQLIMKRRAILAMTRGDEAVAEDDSELEDAERELFTLQLGKALRSAINQIAQAKEELEMLKLMAGRAPPQRQDDPRSRKPAPMPMVRIDPQSSMGVSSRVIQQQILHQQVYNPKLGYNMMPEEWAEQEMAMTEQKEYAEIIAKHEHSVEQNMTFGTQNGGATNEHGRTVVYSDEHAEEDKDDCAHCVEHQEYKDRAWDDWKDEPTNKKGYGNTLKNSSGVSC